MSSSLTDASVYSNPQVTTNDSTKETPSLTDGASLSSAIPSAARGTKRSRQDDDEAHIVAPIPTFAPYHSPPAVPLPAFKAADHANDGKAHLLLGTTGSVATIKLPQILRSLSNHSNLSIRVVLSKSSTRFLQGQSDEQPHWATLRRIPNVDAVYTDEDEWRRPWTRTEPILHIELRRWADLMLVAPLSANALSKMATGICDDIISEVMRAWDIDGTIDGPPAFGRSEQEKSKEQNGTVDAAAATAARKSAFVGDMMSSKYATPSFHSAPEPARPSVPVHKRRKVILVAPAMNTAMWRHPVTRTHLRLLEWDWSVNRDGWIEVLWPQEKALACGDTGDGAMMEWSKIVGVVEERMGLGKGIGRKDGQERDAKRAKT